MHLLYEDGGDTAFEETTPSKSVVGNGESVVFVTIGNYIRHEESVSAFEVLADKIGEIFWCVIVF
jgi:hypothetical protein